MRMFDKLIEAINEVHNPSSPDTNADKLPPYLFGEEVDDEAKAAVAKCLSRKDKAADKLKALISEVGALISDSNREKDFLDELIKMGFSEEESLQIIALMESGVISEDEVPLLVRLREKKTKFSLDKFVFVTKSKKPISGQSEVVFLEEGDDFGGLQHILYGNPNAPSRYSRLKQFQDYFRISDDKDKAKKEIAVLLKDCISNRAVENKDLAETGRYFYKINETCYLCIVVGDNGYIVTAYLLAKEEYDRQAERLSGNK